MKTKLLYSYYDKESGYSEAGIQNKFGRFMAHAQLHPEDKDYESSFFGCQVAEAKCMIKTHRERIRLINLQIKTLEDFEKVLKNLKDYNPKSIECRQLRKQIYLLKQEKGKIVQLIQEINKNIRISEENRKKTLNLIQKKKEDLDKFGQKETIY